MLQEHLGSAYHIIRVQIHAALCTPETQPVEPRRVRFITVPILIISYNNRKLQYVQQCATQPRLKLSAWRVRLAAIFVLDKNDNRLHLCLKYSHIPL